MTLFIPVVAYASNVEVLGAYETYDEGEQELAEFCRRHSNSADLLKNMSEAELNNLGNKEVIEMYYGSESILELGELASIQQKEVNL